MASIISLDQRASFAQLQSPYSILIKTLHFRQPIFQPEDFGPYTRNIGKRHDVGFMIAQKIVHTLRRRLDIQNTRNKYWYQSISDAQERRRLKTSLSDCPCLCWALFIIPPWPMEQSNPSPAIRRVYFSQAHDTMILKISDSLTFPWLGYYLFVIVALGDHPLTLGNCISKMRVSFKGIICVSDANTPS